MAHPKLAKLTGELAEARAVAFKAWTEAMIPLDRKFTTYGNVLRGLQTQEDLSTAVKFELLALVTPCVSSAHQSQYMFVR
mmetsp:Transcript_17876/g.54976  ORF Transcript_17876/g.54976 Transcript_17876/m.54976 type:complete len:80 (-) Transcript_17876:1662-1901(-)